MKHLRCALCASLQTPSRKINYLIPQGVALQLKNESEKLCRRCYVEAQAQLEVLKEQLKATAANAPRTRSGHGTAADAQHQLDQLPADRAQRAAPIHADAALLAEHAERLVAQDSRMEVDPPPCSPEDDMDEDTPQEVVPEVGYQGDS